MPSEKPSIMRINVRQMIISENSFQQSLSIFFGSALAGQYGLRITKIISDEITHQEKFGFKQCMIMKIQLGTRGISPYLNAGIPNILSHGFLGQIWLLNKNTMGSYIFWKKVTLFESNSALIVQCQSIQKLKAFVGEHSLCRIVSQD